MEVYVAPRRRRRKQTRHEAGLETIGSRIIMARERAGLSQEELADLIHRSQRTMQAYEADETAPSTKPLRMMAEILNVTTDWIMEGEDATPLMGDRVAVQELLESLDAKVDKILETLEESHRKPATRRA